MSSFSPDQGQPPSRFRPSAGQVGASAAKEGLKSGRTSESVRGQRRGGGAAARPTSGRKLGLPQRGDDEQQKQVEQRQQNDAHDAVLLYMTYLNSLRLGRAQPFGVWATRSGHARQILPQGQRPYDVYDDLPAGY